MENQQQSEFLYIVAGTLRQFLDEKRNHHDKTCIRVIDGVTLRGRVPGKIIWVGTYRELWNEQEIAESVALHESMWREDLEAKEFDLDQDNMLEYGV